MAESGGIGGGGILAARFGGKCGVGWVAAGAADWGGFMVGGGVGVVARW